ncbi:MAG: LysM peptidoglycan-binding domain-containing protein [Proteobacteria bacterium]|nr:LysM peptidoglycan-binding domain-containing protein [Pseudomonadota bacterium]
MSTSEASPGAEKSVHPGRQIPAPGPTPPAAPPLQTDFDQRRAIRGCPVGAECRKRAEDQLREFELETFGPVDRQSPWFDDTDGSPAAYGQTSKFALQSRRPAVTRGTDVRPDLPWLDQLEMPDLPVQWNERLIEYLEFYKNDRRGRNIMHGWLRAQGKYRDLLVSHLRRARLPLDLLYVAMIESSYDPREHSYAGASGLWQFMPAGGRIYGLVIDRWIDERNDPVRSTEAAMMYWADLYQRFGDWPLAMAAYNAGYGAVLRAVATFNSNDYWELCSYENALPWGTRLYVAKALAAAIVGRNRALFGYAEVKPESPVTWDTATVPRSSSLRAIARAAGTRVEVIRALNPQLRRNRTPPQMTDYVVRIPRERARLFAERFPQLRGDWDRYDAYVVAHGERFEDIATMYSISRRKLARLNGIEHVSEVRGGTVLVVPRTSEADKKRNLKRARQDLYTSGSPRGREGDKLIVAVPDKNLRVAGKRRVFYRVVTGDTLYGVARALGVSRFDLASWNGLDREAHLHPRMILQAFIAGTFSADKRGIALLDPGRLTVVSRGSAEHIAAVETRRGRQRKVYRVDKAESFESIGKKFGLSARDLARINHRPPTTVVEPGEEIIVYIVVDDTRSERAQKQARKQAEATRRRSGKRATGQRAKAGKQKGQRAR